MTSKTPQSENNRNYFGWSIVGASFAFHALFGGLYHTGFSVYFLPLIREFGVSRTKMSFAFAIRTLEGGIEGPLAGYTVDRLGSRIVIFSGVFLGGVGFILLSLTKSYSMFLVVFIGLLTTGFSAPFHGIAASINFWFKKRLGIAMSLASSGSALGGFILTPVVAWVVLTHGWRPAAFISGCILLLMGPGLARMFRNPRNDESSEALTSSDGAKMQDQTVQKQLSADFTIKEALRSRTYWILAVAIGLRLVAQSALMIHMVPMLVSKSVSEGTAASLVAFMSLIRFPAMIGSGLISDGWSRPKVAGICMFFGVLATSSLVLGPPGLISGVAFAALFACAQGSNSITWALIGQFFGRAHFGSLRGGITLIQSIMSTGGPIMAGFIFDKSGNYTSAFLAIGVVYGLSGLIFWGLKPPGRMRAL